MEGGDNDIHPCNNLYVTEKLENVVVDDELCRFNDYTILIRIGRLDCQGLTSPVHQKRVFTVLVEVGANVLQHLDVEGRVQDYLRH